MLLTVSGASFKQSIMNMLNGSTKRSINFTVSKGKLRLQSNSLIIVEETVDILEQDEDKESFTAVINNAISLVSSNYTVNISIVGNTMTISQGTFNYTVAREYDEAINIELQSSDYTSISSVQLSMIDKDVKMLELITKSFGTDSVELNVKSGFCYVDGKSVAYVAPFNFPDMSISSKVIKALNKNVKDAKMCLSGNILEILSGNQRILVSVSGTDIQTVNSIIGLRNDLKLLVSEFNLSEYTAAIDTLYKVYKNSLVDVTICDDGLLFYIDNENVKLLTGHGNNRLCTIQLSIYQVLCMCRIFDTGGSVDIYGGSNKICLIQKSCKRTLILAGIIF